ncbi:hypothetical protein N7457_004141 [Penicillium paradoxum]|uniref:uncharacterized protein n=1 Tax=Penicillium paradoxum TaxID=176176 RepID=UPI002546892A|nr:uncharacterized protein N7457_004141 [Penicillium paradoxum]KAJ5782367.1 hypothetical protein N7457_004141 [Penicillium paradoxum]
MRRELQLRVETLTSRRNWASWKSTIEAHARLEGVWGYCDPDIPDEQYLELKEPEKPHFSTVRPGATSIVDLGEADFAELSSIVNQYWSQMRVYEETQDRLNTIFNLIKTHVNRDHFHLIEHSNTPREQLTILSVEFKQSPLESLEPEWEIIQYLAREPEVQELFARWNNLFADCAKCLNQDARREYAFWDCLEGAANRGNKRRPLNSQHWIQSKYWPKNLGLESCASNYNQRRAQAERDWDAIFSRGCIDNSPPSISTEPVSQSFYPDTENDLSDQPTEVWDGSEAAEDVPEVEKPLGTQHGGEEYQSSKLGVAMAGEEDIKDHYLEDW